MLNIIRAVFFIFLYFSFSAYAAFPAEAGFKGWSICEGGCRDGVLYQDAAQACNATSSGSVVYPNEVNVNAPYVRCYSPYAPNTRGFIYPIRGLVCPENSSLSGSECTCNTGFEERGNQCVQYDACELLESACAGSQNHSVNFQLGGKKTGVSFVCMNPTAIGSDGSFPGCTRGCLGIVGGFTSAFQGDGGDWVTQGTAKFTGSTCDPSVINDLNSDSDPEYEPEDEPNLTEKPDCPNGFKGTVNGVEVCVPPKASEGLLEKEEKDNGDGTKTEKETKVKCENGVCEITTTTITKDTTSNTVVSSSSATTTVEKGKFCSENPTASACKDDSNSEEGKKGSFSGSCQTGFECDGDAAMCAIAIEQHKRACETLEPAKEGIWKDIEAGTDSGSAEAMKREAQTINISTSLNTSGYGLPRSCPADPVIELPFVSKTFSIPFSKACPILKTMSDVALLITALGLLVWLVAPKGKAE